MLVLNVIFSLLLLRYNGKFGISKGNRHNGNVALADFQITHGWFWVWYCRLLWHTTWVWYDGRFRPHDCARQTVENKNFAWFCAESFKRRISLVSAIGKERPRLGRLLHLAPWILGREKCFASTSTEQLGQRIPEKVRIYMSIFSHELQS